VVLSTNKTDHPDITEILLKVALTPSNKQKDQFDANIDYKRD